MEKKNILILILSFATLAIVGSLFYSQNKGAMNAPFVVNQPPIETPPTVPTTPTSQIPKDWKTYENKEFGFAFDYPGEWAVKEDSSMLRTYAPLHISFYNKVSGGTIDVLVLSEKFNPNKIIFNTRGMEGIIEIKKENAWHNLRIIDIASQKGYRFSGGNDACAGDFIQTPIKDSTLQIGFMRCLGDKEDVTKNVKNAAISSLRFFQ